MALSVVDAGADMFVSCRAKGREGKSGTDKDNVCVKRCVCACVRMPVLGVVREMSLLLRVTDINLWESCTLQHTLTEGKRESGGDNVI